MIWINKDMIVAEDNKLNKIIEKRKLAIRVAQSIIRNIEGEYLIIE